MCSTGTRNIVAGMTAAGARRIVVVSSIGAGESRAHSGPATKIAAATVIVRPTMLTNGKRHGARAAADGSIRGGSIARVDVADFVLAQLTSDEWLHQAPLITGP